MTKPFLRTMQDVVSYKQMIEYYYTTMVEGTKRTIQPLIQQQLRGHIFSIPHCTSPIIGRYVMHPLALTVNTLPLLAKEGLRITMRYPIDGNCLATSSRSRAFWYVEVWCGIKTSWLCLVKSYRANLTR
jgi:hypothetical protein